MVSRYKKGDTWRAEDANYVLNNVQQLVGFFDHDLELDKLFLGVMDEDISRDETKNATLWTSDTPPSSTSTTVAVTFDWLSNQKISAGKEVIWAEMTETGSPTVNRIIAAECEDPEPPQSGQIETKETLDASTGVWEAIPGGTTAYNYASGLVPAPAQFGFQVTEPGYYRSAFSFSAEANSNNTTIGIRFVNEDGPSAGITWEVKSAPGSVAGSTSSVAEVTQAEIDAGPVFLTVEKNINNSVDWLIAELTISKLGNAIPT